MESVASDHQEPADMKERDGGVVLCGAVAADAGNADGKAENGDGEEPAAVMSPEESVEETHGLEAARDGIGGYVWKFPSEGSNARPGDEEGSGASSAYPRRCRYCQNAWVSSYANERRHWKTCPNEPDQSRAAPRTANLGVAHRVWCEVDGSLTRLQWRTDALSIEQSDDRCVVPFAEMAEVSVLREPRDSFQVVTTSGRRIVFQCRAEEQEESEHTADKTVHVLDAKQWSEYLQMFSQFTRDQEHEASSESVLMPMASAVHDEVLSQITRAIAQQDVDALHDILTLDDLAPCYQLLDDNGSSLLVVAFKLGANRGIIDALVKAGVDCNAPNQDGESPLLLASASGELVLLDILLSMDGIDVNQRCALGATAFHAAANAGEAEALRILCEAGANASELDDNGWTALHYAAACPTGVAAMRLLCELIPDLVDYQCPLGNSALHVAAGYGCVENARTLLETAANPHLLNLDGHTAYHVALHNNHIRCAMAVHEYMEIPRNAYERRQHVDVSADKVDEIEAAEPTRPLSVTATTDDVFASYGSPWVECVTDEGLPYYYNYATGESTWHRPDDQDDALPPPPPPAPAVGSSTSPEPQDTGFDHSLLTENGQKLPLCMIPLVSPLISLDDPTAATKFDSRRKKDRERRRSKVLKHRERSGSTGLGAVEPTMPPPPPSLAHYHHAKQVH